MPDCNSGPIRKVAIAAAESDLPSNVAKGGAITWGGAWSVVAGGDTEDAYLSEDEVNVSWRNETEDADPPLGNAPLCGFTRKHYPETVTIPLYDKSVAAYAFSTMTDTVGQTITPNTDDVYAAVAVEYAGTGVAYYPRCKIMITGDGGSVTEAGGGVQLEAKVYATSTNGAGFDFREFTSA